MDIPESLDAWIYDTVVAIVEKHEFEPGRYDYKAVLNATGTGKEKEEHLASLRRTTCSMANGDGGYILFGVRDHAMKVAMPKDRIIGIPLASDLRKEYGEKLKPIEREIYFDARAIPLPGDATTCIFIIRVPSSPLRPHSFEGTFFTRGEGGSARPMSYFEVRDQMLYTEGRLQKVRLLRMELAAFRTVIQMLYDPTTWTVRLETESFKVLLADICDLLQPDANLLSFLHDIGVNAAILNQLLDRKMQLLDAKSGTWESQQSATINRDVLDRQTKIFNDSGKAEERLIALFGPLQSS